MTLNLTLLFILDPNLILKFKLGRVQVDILPESFNYWQSGFLQKNKCYEQCENMFFVIFAKLHFKQILKLLFFSCAMSNSRCNDGQDTPYKKHAVLDSTFQHCPNSAYLQDVSANASRSVSSQNNYLSHGELVCMEFIYNCYI